MHETTTKPQSLLRVLFRSDTLAFGYGTAALLWAVGYFTHIPQWTLPSWMVFILLLSALFLSGIYAGYRLQQSIYSGLCIGFIAAVLNILVLGSLITGDRPNQVVPSALIFIPGSIIVTMLLTTAGAWVGKMLRSAPPKPVNGISAFAAVGVLTTFLLLLAGGLVTSWDAGLAVVDWPNSFGYNMFLYPLSRMTGGIYYEHTHRLIGSLVGLTTLMLAILIQVRDKRGWVKGLAWSAFVLVVFQGILGGLRVTGNFTLSTSPEAMQPSLTLALIHGVTGQIFFALLTCLAVITSGPWQRESSIEKPSCATDRILFPLAFAALIIQLVLGATVRHYAEGLMLHIGFAVVVFTVVMTSAVRAWGIYPEKQTLSNLGLWVLSVLCIQFILGFTALWGITADPDPQVYRWFEVLFPTLHQAFGALLLALVVTKTIWFYRAIQPLSIAVAADPAPDTPARPQSA